MTTRTKQPLGADILRRLDDIADRGTLDTQLAAPVAQRIRWVNPAGTTAAVAWWSGHDPYESGVLWHVSPESFTALAGHGWPRGRGWDWSRPWAPQLAALIDTGNLEDHLGRFSGVFAACHLDTAGGVVFSDPFGIGLVHTGCTADYEVFSSRAAIAAALITPTGQSPARDPLSTGWLAFAQQMVADTTTYRGVDILPQCVHVTIGTDGATARNRTTHPSLWHADGLDPDQAVQLIRDDLTSELVAISNMRGLPLVCDLTGGKDSRTILAMVLEAGIADRFEFFTSGPDDLPDVVVAQELRAHFGLRRHPQTRLSEQPSAWIPRPATTSEEGYRQYASVTSGMQNLWFRQVLSDPLERTCLNGIGGEALYTNFPGSAKLRGAPALHDFLRAGRGFGASQVCLPAAEDHYRRGTDALAEELWDGCRHVQDAADRYYVGTRLRRWLGTSQEIDRKNRIFPLISAPAVAAAFGMGHELRQAEYVPFQLMAAVDRTLVTTRFDHSRWPHRLMAHVDDRGVPAEGVAAPTKLPVSKPGGHPGTYREGPRRLARRALGTSARRAGYTVPVLNAATVRRNRHVDEQVAMIRRIAVDDPGNPVFTIIDHKGFSALVDDYDRLPHDLRQLVFGAFTAAVWLGEHDENPFAD